jgi:hypothetical protein
MFVLFVIFFFGGGGGGGEGSELYHHIIVCPRAYTRITYTYTSTMFTTGEYI